MSKVTVTPTRSESRIQVKKNKPGVKSDIIPFEDIDKIQFKVKSTSSKTSSRDSSMSYREIVLVGKLPEQSDRDYRSIVFRLPNNCISPNGVSLKFSYSLGIFFDMEDNVWAEHKEKLMSMRKNMIEALLPSYDDFAADCGMDIEAESDADKRQQISNKLSKLVKPAKAKNNAKVNTKKQYANLDCRYTTFMYQILVNGRGTRNVRKIDLEDLVDTRIVLNGKIKIGNLRGINSATGVSMIATDIVVKSVEPCIRELDVEDDLEDDDEVVDVASQLKEIRATLAESAASDNDMLDSIMKTGNLSLDNDENEVDDDDDDDESLGTPM